jgi:hypothetical protein
VYLLDVQRVESKLTDAGETHTVIQLKGTDFHAEGVAVQLTNPNLPAIFPGDKLQIIINPE